MIRSIVILIFAIQSIASACLWDYDTLTDERRGLPGVAEIIAGRWERHSTAFYRQRIAAMQKLLADRPDDWAPAGMRRKMRITPISTENLARPTRRCRGNGRSDRRRR